MNKKQSSQYITVSIMGYIVCIAVLFFIFFYKIYGETFIGFFYSKFYDYLKLSPIIEMMNNKQNTVLSALELVKQFFYFGIFISLFICFSISYHLACGYFRKLKVYIKPFFLNTAWRPNECLIYGLIIS
ncbi:hypothetical protein ACFL4O_02375, partial [bacterium]